MCYWLKVDRRLRIALWKSRQNSSAMAQQTLLARSVTVPPNLEALMHQLTREILRDQPKNLYEFAADFFARLIEQPEDGESI